MNERSTVIKYAIQELGGKFRRVRIEGEHRDVRFACTVRADGASPTELDDYAFIAWQAAASSKARVQKSTTREGESI